MSIAPIVRKCKILQSIDLIILSSSSIQKCGPILLIQYAWLSPIRPSISIINLHRLVYFIQINMRWWQASTFFVLLGTMKQSIRFLTARATRNKCTIVLSRTTTIWSVLVIDCGRTIGCFFHRETKWVFSEVNRLWYTLALYVSVTCDRRIPSKNNEFASIIKECISKHYIVCIVFYITTCKMWVWIFSCCLSTSITWGKIWSRIRNSIQNAVIFTVALLMIKVLFCDTIISYIITT